MIPQSKANLDTPITAVDQLITFLKAGARPEAEWGIGAEMEKLVIDAETGEAAEFARIEALLENLADSDRWQAEREEGRIIGLRGTDSSVTLEPGGQLELSGKLCPDLYCNCGDFCSHVADLVRFGEPLGLAFLGFGTHPFTPLHEIEWVPKSRYGIMGPYMLRCGNMGQRMMKQSAGLQVNLDFSDEVDCIFKLRLAQAMVPLLYALFANSPVMEDRLTGYLTTRGQIWANTDRDRTGLLPFLLEPDVGLADYVEYALDVPMYFIIRDGRFIDLTGERFPFRTFLSQGFENHRPLLADWDLHLSTLFPEVRLRPQIEVRSADSLPPHFALSVAALLKGIMYDSTSRQAAWEACRPESFEDLTEACHRAWRQGMKAPWGKQTVQALARDCLAMARSGLERQAARQAHGLNETAFLLPLEELVAGGETLAERLLHHWQGGRRAKLAALKEHCGFPGELFATAQCDCPS